MKRIVFPLKLQMKRNQVADLHKALSFMGLQIADPEKDTQRFGTSTREAVRKFQADHQLPGTGVVDEATANALNSLLAERGAFDEEVMYVVKGVVRSANGTASAGVRVQAFDRDVSREELLGSTVTDQEGDYRICFNEAQFQRTELERGGPEVFIRVVGSDDHVLVQSRTIPNAPRQVQIDVRIPSGVFVVRGVARYTDGKSGSQLVVRAFDRNVGAEDTRLGQASTDEQGTYSISYNTDQLGNKLAADLVLRVYRDDNLLQEADVIFNAQPVEVKDFTLFSEEPRQLPEFQRFSDQIAPLLHNNLNIVGLKNEQITFLSGKTGIEAGKIERLAEACRLSNGNELLAIIYYGLLVTDFPIEPGTLLSKGSAEIRRALSLAQRGHVIPELQLQEIDGFIDEELPRRRADELLRPAQPGQRASLGDLLRTMPQPLPEDSQRLVARLFDRDGTDYARLTESLQKAGVDGDQALRVERTLRLGDLTQHNISLTRHLQERVEKAPDPSLKSLASVGRDQWIDMAYAYGISPDASVSHDAYGMQMEAAVEALHPTAVLAARLTSGDLVIGRPGFAEVGRFLDRNPEIDIVTADLNVLKDRANFSEISDQDAVVQSLRKIQRIKKLSANWEETGALLNMGLDSALDIVAAGRDQLRQAVSQQIHPQRADVIYEKARAMHDIGLAVMVNVLPRFSPTPVAAMPMSARKLDTSEDPDDPTLQSLFGPLDYCECRHCQSVLGQAAYFVDLLKFLATNNQSKPQTPAGTNSVTADTTGPAVQLSTTAGATVNGPFTVTATFSEPVTGLAASSITVTNGTVSNLTGSGQHCTFTVTPKSDRLVTVCIPANVTTDAAGNLNTASNTLTVTNDSSAPAVQLSTAAGATVNGPFTVTAKFSEAVNVLTIPNISVTNGTASNLTSSGQGWTFTVTPTTGGTVTVCIPANVTKDAAGNLNTASNTLTVTNDSSAPTVRLTTAGATVNGPFTVTATFSEPVTGLAVGNITVTTNGTVSNLTGSGQSWTFIVNPITSASQSRITVMILANAAKDADSHGNLASEPLTVSYSGGSVYNLPTQPQRTSTLFLESNERSSLVALLDRRPDLVDLELSCANTDIELPHIDLVLEILENAVALPLTVQLPHFFEGAEALVTPWPLEPPITDVLKMTALQVGGDLSANLVKTRCGETLWTVKDRSRQWTLVHRPNGDFVMESAGAPRRAESRAAGIDRSALATELDAGRLSSETIRQIDALRCTQGNGARFLRIIDHQVSPTDTSGRSRLSCRLGVTVSLDTEDGRSSLMLKAPDGSVILTRTYSPQALQATAEGLNRGQIVGPLQAYLPHSESYRVTPVNPGLSTELSSNVEVPDGVDISFTYVPDSLTVTALTYQSVGHSEDLKSTAENQNPEAYKRLGAANFPWSLPFDLPLETLRAHLDRAKTSRRELIELSSPGQRFTDVRGVYELLGLSPREAALIQTKAELSELWQNWGVNPDVSGKATIYDASAGEEVSLKPLELLSRVSILIQQARISMEELQQLLCTGFVGGGWLELQSEDPANNCQPSKLSIDTLQLDHVDSLHRFIRLWRKLGWSIPTLDLALHGLNPSPGEITPDTLKCLSHIKRLQELLDLPVEVLVSWWGGADALTYIAYSSAGEPAKKSLYEELFLNPLVQNPPDGAFALSSTVNVLAPEAKGKTLGEKASLIAAALGVRQSDLRQFLGESGLSDPLSLDKLFELYRSFSLMRALGLTVEDYFSVLRVAGYRPFDNTTTMLGFCEAVAFIRNSDFTIEELAYLLQHETRSGSELASQGEQIDQMLDSIRVALSERIRSVDSQVRELFGKNPGPTVIKLPATDAEAVAIDKAALAIGFAPGDSASRVTQNLILPIHGASGTTIEWDSHSGAVGTDGTVSRPVFEEGDASVTLRAIIIKGAARDKTVFPALTVSKLPRTDAEAVAIDEAVLAIGFAPGDSASRVTQNLVLPTQGASETRIIWQSYNRAVDADGTVRRPAFATGDVSVTLVAIIKKEDAVKEKAFPALTVRKLPQTDGDAVAIDKAALAIGFAPGDGASRVTQNLVLPTHGASGTTIEWDSHSGAVGTDGTVTRPVFTTGDASVTLTATIIKGAETGRKVFYAQDLLDMNPRDSSRLAIMLSLDSEFGELRRYLGDLVIEQVATLLGLDGPVTRQLLDSHSSVNAGTPVAAYLRHPDHAEQDALDVFLDPSFINPPPSGGGTAEAVVSCRLQKAAILVSRLNIDSAQVAWLANLQPDSRGMTALQFNDLPVRAVAGVGNLFSAWQQLVTLFRLRDRTAGMKALLTKYVAALNTEDKVNAREQVQTVLAKGLTLPVNTVRETAALLGLDTVLPNGADPLEKYRTPVSLAGWIDLLTTLKRLGATVPQLGQLTQQWPSDEAGREAATTARSLLRAKYGADSWRDILKPISDKLRIQQRDALVDYLIHKKKLRDANVLYEHYLIDPQMSPCMTTTRLLQAIAAVQLFIQRCLLNLEDDIHLDPTYRERWKWMKNYRVWEANRKVFLYPENWLYPELRDDKTEIFRQIESALTQQEPSAESSRVALLGYVEDLSELAQIQVIAMYQDQATLYVIGRQPNEPYRYFWRSCQQFGQQGMSWSGWEALDLDNANDFIMPFVLEGDLHVAWPIFRKRVDEENKTKLFWDVQIAWMRRTNKGWGKRKIGKAQLNAVERLLNKDETGSFVFRFEKKTNPLVPISGSEPLSQETISIYCYAADEWKQRVYISEPTEKKGDIDVPNSASLPDPIPGNLLPQPFDDPHNTTLTVSGVLYEYANITGVTKYLPKIGIQVELKGWYKFRENDPGGDVRLVNKIVYTNGNGRFDINCKVHHATPVDLFLSYYENSTPIHIGRDNLLNMDQNSNVRLRSTWEWKFACGVENKEIAEDFGRYRPVKYKAAGSLVFRSGGDLLATTPNGMPSLEDLDEISVLGGKSYNGGMSIDGNRFTIPSITQSGDIQFGNTWAWSPPRTLAPPFVITRATQAPPRQDVQADPRVWHVQGNDGGYYLQKQTDGWQCWPDGQPYASSYRTVAALSTSKLFQSALQAYLHIDTSANNFESQYPYTNYNWELFLHAPLLIAEFLTKQQRFEEAQRWLHFVFDPTTDDTTTVGATRFWRFLEFRKGGQSVQDLLTQLAKNKSGEAVWSDSDRNDFVALIEIWRDNPFRPHVIARSRLRQISYQWRALFNYLDDLIAWGDQLFRRDTRESINEAILLYVLAAKLLGPRPQAIKPQVVTPALTYRALADRWDEFSDAWLRVTDNSLVKDLPDRLKGIQKQGYVRPSKIDDQTAALSDGRYEHCRPSDIDEQIPTLSSVGMLYFCIPHNDKLLEYWDKVEDRLFKVRHCMNINGVTRQLPLWQPPIDPGLLVRATAAGLDLDTVLADMSAPLLPYRFNVLLQKAHEICSEVKSLGAALLSALEKKDAEGMALLRSSQEIEMLGLIKSVKKQQIAEAEANVVALNQNQAVVLERFNQYQKLLGKPPASRGPDGLPVLETTSSLQVAASVPGEAAGLALIQNEVAQLVSLNVADSLMTAAGVANTISGVLHAIPDSLIGTVAFQTKFGGSHLGSAAGAMASFLNMLSSRVSHIAGQQGMFAQYQRRCDEWVHQSKLALEELKYLNKQIVAAEIRQAIAVADLENHEKQVENAKQVDEFMHDKYTNRELYSWMVGVISGIYFNSYQLACDVAKRAEKAFQYELGVENTSFIQYGYWDSLKKGLLSGENLSLDLKRMEVAYLEQNRREFEISKHVSLLQLDPVALINLKETGTCEVSIPEALFDIDFPGHYFRRIKSVSLTIPCVAGPYTSVNCTLRLLKHSYRRTTQVSAGGYQRDINSQGIPTYDDRFVDSMGMIQSIATSHGQNDSGMFELNFRDERYLPFEGAGAISTWRIELPNEFRQFDYDTIADVILHMKYTAREGGDLLKQKAVGSLKDAINKIVSSTKVTGLLRLFSLKHEFPSEWHRFLTTGQADGNHEQTFTVSKSRFPFIFHGRAITINAMDIMCEPKDDNELTLLPNLIGIKIIESEPIGRLKHQITDINWTGMTLGKESDQLDLKFYGSEAEIALYNDILIVCHYMVK